MTTETRKKLLERVKAILAKTMANGCTEAEAMAALAKARELMATYEIDEKELKEFDREKAAIHRTAESDPYDIKQGLSFAVAAFTRCKSWGGKVSPISFVGMESDVIFATWLLDTLQRFVMRELRTYQKQRIAKGGFRASNNLTSSSFVYGCKERINEKLKELTVPMPAQNKAIIEAELEKHGIKLQKFVKRSRAHEGSMIAGAKAGEHARFDRPVGSDGKGRLLK